MGAVGDGDGGGNGCGGGGGGIGLHGGGRHPNIPHPQFGGAPHPGGHCRACAAASGVAVSSGMSAEKPPSTLRINASVAVLIF